MQAILQHLDVSLFRRKHALFAASANISLRQFFISSIRVHAVSSSVRLRRSTLPLDSVEYAVVTSCTMPRSFSQSWKFCPTYSPSPSDLTQFTALRFVYSRIFVAEHNGFSASVITSLTAASVPLFLSINLTIENPLNESNTFTKYFNSTRELCYIGPKTSVWTHSNTFTAVLASITAIFSEHCTDLPREQWLQSLCSDTSSTEIPQTWGKDSFTVWSLKWPSRWCPISSFSFTVTFATTFFCTFNIAWYSPFSVSAPIIITYPELFCWILITPFFEFLSSSIMVLKCFWRKHESDIKF